MPKHVAKIEGEITSRFTGYSGEIDVEMQQYLQAAELGSPRYLAFMDKFAELELYKEQTRLIQEMSKGPPETQLLFASQLRITEFEMAIHNRQMANRKAEIRGYLNEVNHFEGKLEDLAGAVEEDLQKEGGLKGAVSSKRANNQWEAIVTNWWGMLITTQAT